MLNFEISFTCKTARKTVAVAAATKTIIIMIYNN